VGKAVKKSIVKGPAKSAASRNGSAAKSSASSKPAAKPASKPAGKTIKPAARSAKPASPAKVIARQPAKSAVKPAKPIAGKPATRPDAKAPALAGKGKSDRMTEPKQAPVARAGAAAAPQLSSAAPAKPAMKPAIKPGVPSIDPKAKAQRLEKPARIEAKPEPYRPMNVVEQASSSGDSKPKKNQAGLSARELEHFRDLLLEKRRELVGDMNSMEREALQSGDSGLSTLPIHMADMGTDNYEQEFTLGLVEKDRTLLREINHALAKIQNGTYGLCEGNGKPIAKVRLEAHPWARFSIEFARLQEKGPIRR